jgi:hypothetical protein
VPRLGARASRHRLAGRPGRSCWSRRSRPRRMAAPGLAGRPADRLGGPLPARDSRARLRRLVPAVGSPGEPDRHRVAGRARRADARGPQPRDVRLPQQPAGDPCRLVAVVGLAGQPEAGLVLPGFLRRQHGRGNLRQRQPGDLVALDPRLRLRRVAGVPAPEPGLAFVTIMFALLPWARIDQGRSSTTTTPPPFVLLLATSRRVWHGPSRRTAPGPGRRAGALAPVVMWLSGPLVCPHRVEKANG